MYKLPIQTEDEIVNTFSTSVENYTDFCGSHASFTGILIKLYMPNNDIDTGKGGR